MLGDFAHRNFLTGFISNSGFPCSTPTPLAQVAPSKVQETGAMQQAKASWPQQGVRCEGQATVGLIRERFNVQ